MRSDDLNLNNYHTDKIESGYLAFYDPIFTPLAWDPVLLLEIGVLDGESLRLWRDFFPKSAIVGIDIKLPENFEPGERLNIFEGSQTDLKFLNEVSEKVAPDGFDIIIDDASHIGELTRTTFWYLFDHHLKPGGIYVIEDWGTGYWGDWPDGKKFKSKPSLLSRTWSKLLKCHTLISKLPVKIPLPSHNYGMVGLIKQLIDEQGAADLSRGELAGKPGRPSKFSKMLIYPSLVFIYKTDTVL